jgi:tryptophan synthase beta chain
MIEAAGRLPDIAVACVGGGSNSLGLFDAFVDDSSVRLVGVEAGGRALTPGDHAARLAGGAAGVLHGTRSLVLQDDDGNILPTHSISAGLDYPSIGPEHAWLAAIGRSEYTWIDDRDALAGFEWLARTEGLLPALESAHAAAWARRALPDLAPGTILLVNLSGRGDKDVETVRHLLALRAEGDR